MIKQKYDRINSLKSMAENKSVQTLSKVEAAIKEMEQNNIALTFQLVAKTAKISKTWLYNNQEISTYIRSHRGLQNNVKKMLDNVVTTNNKNKQIEALQKRMAAMSNEIDTLKKQLEIAYAELYKR